MCASIPAKRSNSLIFHFPLLLIDLVLGLLISSSTLIDLERLLLLYERMACAIKDKRGAIKEERSAFIFFHPRVFVVRGIFRKAS